MEAVSIALHLGELPPARIRELTLLLFETAARGDAVARKLIRRQAREILAQHRAAATRLGLLNRPHALVLGGGVLRAQHPLLHQQVVEGASTQAPQVRISVLDTPPAVGAALLALDDLGATGGSEAALRTTMATAQPATPARAAA